MSSTVSHSKALAETHETKRREKHVLAVSASLPRGEMASSECVIAGVPLHNILAVFGAVCLAGMLAKLVLQLWSALRLFVLPFSTNLRRMGEWAVVTGATDGIGKAYVEQLARKGMNVLLVSRTESKLSACVAEFREQFPKLQFASCAVDFSGGAEIYQHVRHATAGLDIGVLINNVGMVPSHPMYFDENSEQDLWRMINVNVASVTFMTHLLLPGMLKKGRGAVVNVSSIAGITPNPLHTVYSGTKAFVDLFTQGLVEEYSGRGVHFQCVMPGFVATNMTRIRKGSLFVPFPSSYVKQALGTVGLTSRTHGYWPHSLQVAIFFRSLPSFIIVSYIKSLHVKFRGIALRKKQRESEKKRE